MSLKAVLFDFDDTLFDHKHSYQKALKALYDDSEILQTQSFAMLEDEYTKCLEDFHTLTIQGQHSLDQIRTLRTQSIFRAYGVELSDEEAFARDKIFRTTYKAAQQEVPGTTALLDALKKDGYQIGVVTNHISSEQERKIQELGFKSHVDVLVAAHDYGISKPDPQVFTMILDALEVEAHETVMVGDSWRSDVEGAHALGIRSIWLNRYNHDYPDPNKAVQITALLPTADVLALIVGTA